MADLSADGTIRFGGEYFTRKWYLDTSAAQTVYKRQPMILDNNVDSLNPVGYKDAVVLTTSDHFLGILLSAQTSVVLAAAETTEIEVLWKGIVGFPTTTLTNASVGAPISMADSGVVGLDAEAAGFLLIGKLQYVENGYAFVDIDAPHVCVA
jgi:hypothetical protein